MYVIAFKRNLQACLIPNESAGVQVLGTNLLTLDSVSFHITLRHGLVGRGWRQIDGKSVRAHPSSNSTDAHVSKSELACGGLRHLSVHRHRGDRLYEPTVSTHGLVGQLIPNQSRVCKKLIR